MYLKGEVEFIEYIKANSSEPDSRFLNDKDPTSTLEKMKGQVVYFLRIVITLLVVQMIGRCIYTLIAVNTDKLSIVEYDSLGNQTIVEVQNADAWVCYKTFGLLKRIFHILNI